MICSPLNAVGSLLMVAASCLLTGCISVFPQSDPAQLYRFGIHPPEVQRTASAEPVFNVYLGQTGFDSAAAGDRILTVSGTQAAFIKDARWVTSSEDLFDSALHHAFEAEKGPARLVGAGDIARADSMLKLDVRAFEVRYSDDQSAPPVIVVEVQATLTRTGDQTVVADRGFKISLAAGDNRVSAITEAFDQVVTQILGKLVSWVDSHGSNVGPSHSSL
jgi:cholesterol transport system auxiliary component